MWEGALCVRWWPTQLTGRDGLLPEAHIKLGERRESQLGENEWWKAGLVNGTALRREGRIERKYMENKKYVYINIARRA